MAKSQVSRHRGFRFGRRLEENDDVLALPSLDALRAPHLGELAQQFFAAIRETAAAKIQRRESVTLQLLHKFGGGECLCVTLPASTAPVFKRTVAEA